MTNDTEETILDECTEEKDLGVRTSSNMKPVMFVLGSMKEFSLFGY